MRVAFKAIVTENGKGIFHLFPALCKGCGLCIEKCPVDTIGWAKQLGAFGTPVVEPGHGKPCIACKKCQLVCPDAAIWIERRVTGKRPAPKEGSMLHAVQGGAT